MQFFNVLKKSTTTAAMFFLKTRRNRPATAMIFQEPAAMDICIW